MHFPITHILILSAGLFYFSSAADTLKTARGKIITLSGAFTQVKSSALFAVDDVKSGVFFYESDDKFRWEFQKPKKFVILLDGKDFYLIEKGKKKKAPPVGPVKFIRDLLLGSLSGDIFSNDEAYTISSNVSGKFIIYNIIPKKPGQKRIINEMNLFLNKKNYLCEKIVVNEKAGDVLTIRFKAQRVNEKLPDGIFSK